MDADLYKGREQTMIKHAIFGHYLQKFACIVGSRWDSITYVDCFSGPWQQRADDFSDTSFGIAIKHLREAREAAAKIHPGKNLKLRCFFVEKDKAAYLKLKAHAEKQKDLDIVTVNDEFETVIPQIIQFVKAGGANTFPFFFIDPTGWTGFAMDELNPIFALQPKVELMVNLMTSFTDRFVGTHESIPKLFGFDARPQLEHLEGLELADTAVDIYLKEVQKRGGFSHTCPALVLRPGVNKTHFHILYATRHQKGLEVFKEAEKAAATVMRRTQAQLKVERVEGPQEFLFPPEEAVPESTAHYDSLRKRYLTASRKRVCQLLMTRREVGYDEVWLEALHSTPLVWTSDLKEWINEWRAADQVAVTLAHNERVPKLGKGHRLRVKAQTLV